MKFPKNFIPKKNLADKVKQLIKNPLKRKNEFDERIFHELLLGLEEFAKTQAPSLMLTYKVAQGIASQIDYTKKHIEKLTNSMNLEHNMSKFNGYYLSALVNKIIKEDDIINVTLKDGFHGIGALQKKGILVVKGNVGQYCGMDQRGGEIIIHGNVDKGLGMNMLGGKIIVYGNVDYGVGFCMRGGEIYVFGEIRSIGKNCNGKIYKNNQRIRPTS